MEYRVRRRIHLGTRSTGFGEGYILVHGVQGSEKYISRCMDNRVRRRIHLDPWITGFRKLDTYN